MNKLSKRLGAVGLAAALAFTFMPATALADAPEGPGLLKKGTTEVEGSYVRGLSDNEITTYGEGDSVVLKGVKKLYLSNTGYTGWGDSDDEEQFPNYEYDEEHDRWVPVRDGDDHLVYAEEADPGNIGDKISVVAAKKTADKKTHYFRIDADDAPGLTLMGGDYELDLYGNQYEGGIYIADGATLKITDSKQYKKKTAKGDFDTNAPDGYKYENIAHKKEAPYNQINIVDTTGGYDDTKLYGGYNLKTVPVGGAIGGEALADEAQGTKFNVGAINGFIEVGGYNDADEPKLTKGTLTLNDNNEIVDTVVVFNGTFTQNGGWVKNLNSVADSSSDLEAANRTTSKITINKTSGTDQKFRRKVLALGDGEQIAGLANGESLKKGETVKIKAGTFIGDNPAKLGEDDTNTIGNIAEIGNAAGTVFTVAPSEVKGVGYALNGAVTCKATANTDFRIATTKHNCNNETATAGTTLKATADNRVSYAVITTKITYTDILETKDNANQVSYDTHVIADGGYVQDKEALADEIKGTYLPAEETTNAIWSGGNDASQDGEKKLNSYEDKDGDPGLGKVLNELESVEETDVAGNAGIVKDDFTYERSIELNAYVNDKFDALTGLGENVDTANGITYFTKDPSAYVEENYGVAVIDGDKWIISGDAADFDKTSELAAVAKKAKKSIEIKRVDGHLNDEGKIDNSSAGVAFEMDPALADTLKIAAPADVVVASTLDITNGRSAADNFYTVYVYGLDASLGAASDFGVDLSPVDLQDITFTVRQIPAKAAVVVTDIAKGVKVETATGIEYYALYDSADSDDADYNFGATDDVIAALHKEIEGEAAEFNSGVVYVSDGIEGSFVKVADAVEIKADDASRFVKSANATAGFNDWNVTANVAVYRVYNPNSGEHVFITKAGQAEIDMLVAYGWTNEGIKWKAPKVSELAVYRAYNPNSGLHYYTANKGEYDILVSMGWSADQGISFYSAAPTAAPIYCEYNANGGTHNYTAEKAEHDFLIANGWTENAVTFYGVK